MFRSDQQRGAVCHALTQWISGGPFWTDDGEGVARPSQAAVDVREGTTGHTKSERTMVLIAWDVWNGDGGALFANALHSFDTKNLAMLGELLVALAGNASAIDAWLERRAPRG